jgi:hypothetical protein
MRIQAFLVLSVVCAALFSATAWSDGGLPQALKVRVIDCISTAEHAVPGDKNDHPLQMEIYADLTSTEKVSPGFVTLSYKANGEVVKFATAVSYTLQTQTAGRWTAKVYSEEAKDVTDSTEPMLLLRDLISEKEALTTVTSDKESFVYRCTSANFGSPLFAR